MEGIPYRDGLVQSLERSLSPTCALRRKPGKPGEGFRISLETGDKIAQTDDGRELPVMGISIEEEKESAFYFGFVATFEILASGYALQHASVSVFQDLFAGISMSSLPGELR
jgi:hypothetical protein